MVALERVRLGLMVEVDPTVAATDPSFSNNHRSLMKSQISRGNRISNIVIDQIETIGHIMHARQGRQYGFLIVELLPADINMQRTVQWYNEFHTKHQITLTERSQNPTLNS